MHLPQVRALRPNPDKGDVARAEGQDLLTAMITLSRRLHGSEVFDIKKRAARSRTCGL